MAYGTNAPFGLKPYASRLGGPWVPQLNKYKIAASADGTRTYGNTADTAGSSIFTGDPVFFNGSNTYNQLGTIAVQRDIFTNSTPLPIGVFQGCEYYDTNNILQKKTCWIGGTPVYPGTSITAYVIDDPFVVWDIQVSSFTNVAAATVATQIWIGDNVKLGIGGGGGNIVPNNPVTGNYRTGVSAYYLDGSSLPTDDTELLALKIIDFTPNPQNYQILANPDGSGNTLNTRPFLNMLVMFNAHYFKSPGTNGTRPS